VDKLRKSFGKGPINLKYSKQIWKKVFYLSIAINFLFVFNVIQTDDGVDATTPLFLKNKTYQMKTSNYEVYKTKQANIVMLGDSITYGVDWHELLGRSDVVNRGIGGDYTEGMLHRLHYIYKIQPKVVFIMGGINDLQWNAASPEQVANNHKAIIIELKMQQIQPIITSTLYVAASRKSHKKINKKVDQLNNRLQQIAKEYNVPYIDLNSMLANGKVLNSTYTVDGIHLLGNAYRIWGNEVARVLNSME